jgi:Flp pilus assembly protein TadG
MRDRHEHSIGNGERGAALVFVALFMLFLMGVLALAIDLGMLYVGRSEAQRAADAAALAGAYVFQQNGCTTTNSAGAVDCSKDTTALANAKGQAESVGNTNYVLGHAVDISDGGSSTPPVCATGASCPETSGGDVEIAFPDSTSEPEVTVHVWLANVPTIFAKLFGSQSASVATVATAEAYQGPQTVRFPKPFGVPNCDLNGSDTLPYNSGFCGTGTPSPREFVDPATQVVDTSVYGLPILLHFQSSATISPVSPGQPVPSQFFLLQIAGPGANNLSNSITMSSDQSVSCGESLPVETGNTANGGVAHPVDNLIHSWRNGNPVDGIDNGQDTISDIVPATVPLSYTMTGGSNNSNSDAQGQTYGGPSPSVQWVPIFNAICSSGGSTCAGSSDLSSLNPGSGQGVQVVGFMQLFLVDAEATGNSGNGTKDVCNPTGQNWQGDSPVCAYVLQIAACNTSGSTDSASPVPLRLIQGPE